ncbi:MAG: tRNA pseudouridine(55) synthase TruB, partial [Gemmatimonadetes bacterium]|nr:tRNA pseudouridine(55) synthase TruB [Gemmatimonadota bacterium]
MAAADPADSGIEGVLPIDKPVGPTSHDMVARARRVLGTRRIGHTGTLDPMASGLLLLCIGRATRIAEYLTGMDKRYSAVVRLGVSTDTDDAAGSVIAEHPVAGITEADVERALDRQRGDISQIPSSYSAKKVGGERAYAMARQGREVNLEAVPVSIRELTVTRFDLPDIHIDVTCSSGTYIRAIARDLGADLGVGAHLTALRR